VIDVTLGVTASRSRTATDEDVRAFVALVGDNNPVHTDDAFAARTRFGARIAPGMWSASLVSGLLGSELPGPATIYLSQSIKFMHPVFIGDTVTATVEVVRVREDKPIVTLATTCRNQNGDVVLEGEAVVLVEILAVGN
jgi:3-hydroxybutyryl-CoA dehydratase